VKPGREQISPRRFHNAACMDMFVLQWENELLFQCACCAGGCQNSQPDQKKFLHVMFTFRLNGLR
jgi:hypothetical protein